MKILHTSTRDLEATTREETSVNIRPPDLFSISISRVKLATRKPPASELILDLAHPRSTSWFWAMQLLMNSFIIPRSVASSGCAATRSVARGFSFAQSRSTAYA